MKERCGLFAISGVYDKHIGTKLYNGLRALQHRGQESAGVVIIDTEPILTKRQGLVDDLFSKFNHLYTCGGRTALGHVRYGRDGETDKESQPILLDSPLGEVYLAYNGCISNREELICALPQSIALDEDSISDVECIGYTLIENAKKKEDIVLALKQLMLQVKGAYTLVAVIQGTIYCLRDKFGFRPL